MILAMNLEATWAVPGSKQHEITTNRSVHLRAAIPLAPPPAVITSHHLQELQFSVLTSNSFVFLKFNKTFIRRQESPCLAGDAVPEAPQETAVPPGCLGTAYQLTRNLQLENVEPIPLWQQLHWKPKVRLCHDCKSCDFPAQPSNRGDISDVM